jgi:hypothetical protein
MDVTASQIEGDGLAQALGPDMDLGGDAATRTSQSFVRTPVGVITGFAGTCRVLMSADNGAVDKMQAPVNSTLAIG